MDELEISGKRYVSSRRAAKEYRYHVDYIGQLIRSGKVTGTKVGRAWYVDQESLATYLGQEFQEPQEPVRVVIAEVVPQPLLAEEPEEILPEEPSEPIVVVAEKPFITQAPALAGLRYISDEEPFFRAAAQSVPLHRQESSYQPIPTPHAPQRRQEEGNHKAVWPRALAIGVLGLIIAVAAFGSSFMLQYQISTDGKTNQASVGVLDLKQIKFGF